MTLETALVMLAAGFFAGTLNAAAGGGSFVSIPAMISSAFPPWPRTVLSTVALVAGHAGQRLGLAARPPTLHGIRLPVLLLISLAGGLAGALCCSVHPQRAFDGALPWLLLVGTLAFAFGRPLGARSAGGSGSGAGPCSPRRSCCRSTPATSAVAWAS